MSRLIRPGLPKTRKTPQQEFQERIDRAQEDRLAELELNADRQDSGSRPAPSGRSPAPSATPSPSWSSGPSSTSRGISSPYGSRPARGNPEPHPSPRRPFAMHKEPLHGDDIFLIRDFLTPEECGEHITLTEAAGYDDAPISTGRGFVMRKDVRNNDRVMIDDPPLAAELFERAKPFLAVELPDLVAGRVERAVPVLPLQPGAEVRLALRRGVHPRERGQQQADVHGLPERRVPRRGDGVQPATVGKVEGEETLRVFPVAGTALVFRHDVLHTGAMVLQGTKYVMRTDVMFRHPDARPEAAG